VESARVIKHLDTCSFSIFHIYFSSGLLHISVLLLCFYQYCIFGLLQLITEKLQLRYQISEDAKVAMGYISSRLKSYYSPSTVSVIM